MIKKFIALCCLIFALSGNALAASNMPTGDVGNFGVWATDHNRDLFVNNLTDDITAFQSEFQNKILVKDYVPIEARVGRAFIGGMSMISNVLERSLVRFVTIFLITMFAFWIALEAYHMMKETQKSRELVEEIIKKGLLITIWIFIIEQGPAQLFMWIMGPIITIGTYLSDLILNSVTSTVGVSLPDTCNAIHNYVANSHSQFAIMSSDQVANLLCLPTRLSGFFYTAVAAGWKWMLAGIGTSAFTFITGAVFVVIFIYNIWKFALMSLSVIADLFLGVMMLPFTAIAQTFGGKSSTNTPFGVAIDAFGTGGNGKTNYKGYAGEIFNGFLDLFALKNFSLDSQIKKFINAMIYFVSLSIVIALCAAILSGVVDANLAATVPTLQNDDFMTTLIVGCLVAYLAAKAGDIAKKIGGNIDEGFGKKVNDDLKKIWGNTTKTAKDWWKIARGGDKKK